MTLYEVNEATTVIYDAAGSDANIIFGAVIDPTLDDEIRVTVIATGFGTAKRQMIEKMEQPESAVDLFERRADLPYASRLAGFERSATAEQLVAEAAETINVEDLEVPAFLRNRSR